MAQPVDDDEQIAIVTDTILESDFRHGCGPNNFRFTPKQKDSGHLLRRNCFLAAFATSRGLNALEYIIKDNSCISH